MRVAAVATAEQCPADADVKLTSTCFLYGGDSVEYRSTARSLAHGDGYRLYAKTAHHPPAYSVYLAAWVKLGVSSVDKLRLATTLLGVAIVAVWSLVARRVAGDTAGLVAAFLVAVVPGAWINDTMLMSEPMSTLAAGLCVLAGYRLWRRPDLGSACLLGAAGGLAGLSRSEGPIIVALIAGTWAVSQHAGAIRHRVAVVGAVGAVGLVVMAPWLVRNATAFHDRVGLTSTAGQSIYLSNRPSTYYGGLLGSKDGYADLGTRTIELGGLDESQVDSALSAETKPFMKANVGRLPVVMLARVGRQWVLYQPFQTARIDALVDRRPYRASQVGIWTFWAELALAVAGTVILFRRGVRLSPLMAVLAAATAAGVGNFGSTRYRASGELVLIVLAAVALAAAGSWVRRRRSGAGAGDTSGRPAGAVPSDGEGVLVAG